MYNIIYTAVIWTINFLNLKVLFCYSIFVTSVGPYPINQCGDSVYLNITIFLFIFQSSGHQILLLFLLHHHLIVHCTYTYRTGNIIMEKFGKIDISLECSRVNNSTNRTKSAYDINYICLIQWLLMWVR